MSSFTTLPQSQKYIQGTPKIFPLSRDHKPSDDLERKRIIEAGG
jgi:Protein phosphatase 2C